MKKISVLIMSLLLGLSANAAYLLIPMDQSQKNHLKAYGIAYWVLKHDVEVSWLLNYQGGSFMCKYDKLIENECVIRGVSYQVIADAQSTAILTQIADPEVNMDEVKLFKAPRIAVYSPKNKLPWDDAVTLALQYAEIPYDVIYDEEVINGILPMYDWLHMHHEDFTGQYGKFWAAYHNVAWYKEDVRLNEEMAAKLGFQKVSQMKLAVVKKIREFVAGGGYLFSMCSAPDSYDIALAADGVDICDVMFDHDPADRDAQSKLAYDNCFAFRNFKLVTNPYEYEVSSIDVSESRKVSPMNDYFTLFDFSAKWDPVPTMLCQDHEQIIHGFRGQTTAFRSEYIKPEVVIMGETKSLGEARYIHGDFGKGTWTFYGGHDPEDYEHRIGDPPTDLNLHPNSPGYRLILNNVLFPAAKKKKQKT
ncbi:MAG TPA: asparagine synthetase B [Bacteroidales bacterium]|nr:asparagine synthetase B [Bacteroidales bacterium]